MLALSAVWAIVVHVFDSNECSDEQIDRHDGPTTSTSPVEETMSTITYQDLPAVDIAPERGVRTASSAPVRLTRRGRAAIFMATTALLGALAVVLGSSGAASDDASEVATTTVQVQPGQTLWDIAVEANPDGDVRGTIDDIVELNSLPNASGLKMGSTLAVPVYGD